MSTRSTNEDDAPQNDDLYDDTYDSQDDFLSANEMRMENTATPDIFTPEQMESAQFLEPCFFAKQRGSLREFLSVLGIISETGVTKVLHILDEHYPTLLHETDALFQAMEEEYCQLCLGGASKVGHLTEEGFMECEENLTRRLHCMKMLYTIRIKRLGLRVEMNKSGALDGSDN